LPFDQTDAWQMPSQLQAIAATGPVHRVRTRVGDPAWLVTAYPLVRELLGDERLGMSHPDPDTAARLSDSAIFGGRPLDNFETEHADRARMRALLLPYFLPSRMRALRPRVDALVTALLDDLGAQTPPADLNVYLAVPLPVLVICELLGVPTQDRGQFRAYSQGAASIDDHQRSAAGLAALWEYTRGLVAQKRAHPQDDLISGLCRAEDDTLDDDYIATLAAFVLFAGHETTVVQIGLGAARLLSSPAHRQALIAHPEATSALIEEYLRVNKTGDGGIPRYARCDIDIAGVPIHTGELVLLDIGAANHDHTAFEQPHQVDIDRRGLSHLGFGHGNHYCLGAPLARVELTAVFTQLSARFPTMRLAIRPDHLRWRSDLLTGGFGEIPVTW
jgi:pentalenolactone synthase